jgi:hypothetical protein
MELIWEKIWKREVKKKIGGKNLEKTIVQNSQIGLSLVPFN